MISALRIVHCKGVVTAGIARIGGGFGGATGQNDCGCDRRDHGKNFHGIFLQVFAWLTVSCRLLLLESYIYSTNVQPKRYTKYRTVLVFSWIGQWESLIHRAPAQSDRRPYHNTGTGGIYSTASRGEYRVQQQWDPSSALHHGRRLIMHLFDVAERLALQVFTYRFR